MASCAFASDIPGRRRPTFAEIEELVAAEVAAAERDLAAGLTGDLTISVADDAELSNG